MPTVAPDILTGMRENLAATMGEDVVWAEMFANTNFKPVAVPLVRDTVEDPESSRGDLVRPKRRLQVRANRALYVNANANTMARSRGHAVAQ